jgi:hypothetical protein
MENSTLKLYKYQRINHHLIDSLKNNTIHFTCPNNYNDPFDCRLKLIIDGTKEEWELYRQRINLPVNELDDYISKKTITQEDSGVFNKEIQQNALLKARISCFSEIPDNILMWSHYADSHKGVCLMFETIKYDTIQYMIFNKEDLNYVSSNLPPNYSGILKICYSKTLPEAYNHLEYNQDKLAPFLITKSEDWSYEKEWRMLLPEEALRTENPRYIKDQLKGIIFGLNCSTENIGIIKETVKDTGVQFFQTHALKDEYRLEIKKI